MATIATLRKSGNVESNQSVVQSNIQTNNNTKPNIDLSVKEINLL